MGPIVAAIPAPRVVGLRAVLRPGSQTMTSAEVRGTEIKAAATTPYPAPERKCYDNRDGRERLAGLQRRVNEVADNDLHRREARNAIRDMLTL